MRNFFKWLFTPTGYTEPKVARKVHRQIVGGKVVAQFTALQTFKCEELESEYVMGMTYNLREGNTLLLNLINDQWIKEGKIRLGT